MSAPAGAWLPVLAAVIEDHSPSAGSALHGRRHWRSVAATGLWLSARTPGADPAAVVCFGLLHDCLRVDDGADAAHGERSGELVNRLDGDVLRLDSRARARLRHACATHSTGAVTTDATLGCCYDADRLQLIRLGREPARRLLSTAAARLPAATVAARRALASPPDWAELASRVVALTGDPII